MPNRTPKPTEQAIEKLRRLRFTSTRIAGELGVPTSTVCAVLARLGLNRLSKLEPPEPRTATADVIPASRCTWT